MVLQRVHNGGTVFLFLLVLWTAPVDALSVRVLLDSRASSNAGWSWNIHAAQGLRLYNAQDVTTRFKSRKPDITVRMADGKLMANDARLQCQEVTIEPLQGRLAFQGQEYEGTLTIVVAQDKVYAINVVDLEDYVCAVLRTEGWPGWPLEINKVLAIVSRTYVIAKIMEARKASKLFDVMNTNKHQTYGGWHNRPVEREAVEQTRSLFLAFEGKPIIAMFDVCCGGIIPAKTEGIVDFTKAPYLARTYACDYCRHYSKVYSWQVALPLKQLEKMLHENHQVKVDPLQSAHITRRDDAGLVREVTFNKGLRQKVALSVKHMYALIKEVKSYCFSVVRRGGSVVFKGKGFGHHIGLCQWGARRLVDEGWDYRSILQFYYPLTTFMKLEVAPQELEGAGDARLP